MLLDIQIPALVVTGFINLGLGFLVYSRARQDISNILFFAITLFIMVWSLSMALWRSVDIPALEYVSARAIYISAAFIAGTFLLFALSFLSFQSFAQISKITRLIIFGITTFIAILVLLPGALLKSAFLVHGANYKAIVFGENYIVYAAYIVIFFTVGIVILLKKLWAARDMRRVQLKYVLTGVTLSTAGAMTTNLFLPWFGIFQLFWLGPPLTVIMVVLFAYSIVKHHLLNVRVVATELFTALILTVVFIDAVLAESPVEFITRISTFVIILIFGVFLIRGTLREIKELERLSKAKSDFVAIVSHQLRTPLATIKGFMSMIKEGSGTDAERKNWLDKTYITNERMIRLVNDILNISRIERGKMQYNFQDINVAELIEGIIQEMRIQAEEKEIMLNWEKPAVNIPEIRADEEKLRQVILNLVDNAIHYTTRGHINVRLTYFRDLNRIKITVQDTGIGMTREDLENLFEQFSRGEAGQKRNVEGLGLGLYVAQSIIKAHNGKIWAESEGPHKGSRFYVELPVT